MRKTTKILFGILLIPLMLSSCSNSNNNGNSNNNNDENHEHTYSDVWSYDDTYHWHASTCGHVDQVKDKEKHTFGDWAIDNASDIEKEGKKHRTCTKCGYTENDIVSPIGTLDKIRFEFNEEEDAYYAVAKNRDISGKLVIPSSYNDHPVKIGKEAFGDCNKLNNIVISEGITHLGFNAFASCQSLYHVTLPSTLSTYDDNSNHPMVMNVFSGSEKIIEIINKSYLPIDNYGSSVLTESYYNQEYINIYSKDSDYKTYTTEDGFVIYPHELGNVLIDYVGESINVIVPEGVVAIDSNAFSLRNDIYHLSLPSSLKFLGEGSFIGLQNLTRLTINRGFFDIKYCRRYGESFQMDINNFPKNISLQNKLVEVINKSEVELDDFISYSVYGYYNTGVHVITNDDDSVLEIHEDGFVTLNDKDLHYYSQYGPINEYTTLLVNYLGKEENIEIPNYIQNIKPAALSYIDTIKSVTVAKKIDGFGENLPAFCLKGCNNLNRVIFEGTYRSEIGVQALSNCPKLYSVSLSGSCNFNNNAISESDRLVELINYDPDPWSKVEEVEATIVNFNDDNESKLSISNDGFVTILDNDNIYTWLVDYIGEDVDIKIPDNIDKIHKYALNDNYNLNSITLNNDVSYIGYHGLSKYVKMNRYNNGLYLGSDNNPYLYFADCKDYYSSVNFHSDCKFIGKYCGYYVNDEITLPNTVIELCESSMQSCSFPSITLSNNLKVIEKYAFSYSALSEITLPKSIQYIGDYAFAYSEILSSITYEGTKEEWENVQKGKNIFLETLVNVIHCSNGDIEI